MQPRPSKITTTEWGLVIGAVIAIDLTEFALDWLLIGIAVNECIDVFVGMALPFYFHLRGVTFDTKRGSTWIASTLFEMVTDGLIPIGWTTDVALTWYFDHQEKKAWQKTQAATSQEAQVVGRIGSAEDNRRQTRRAA